MNPTPEQLLCTILFALALIHTFSVKKFLHIAHESPKGSMKENLFHLLGEVEIVFGLWAGVFVITLGFWKGFSESIHYLESLHFTEPLFVFAIMSVAATRPVLDVSTKIMLAISKMIPVSKGVSFYFTLLTAGPFLGSFITEPAAMTVTAFLLKRAYYDQNLSRKFMYSTIGLLFVNVSIGGTLTHFAAPPVLMVASKWGWDFQYMLTHFAPHTIPVVIISALFCTLYNLKELKGVVPDTKDHSGRQAIPLWVSVLQLSFLAIIVIGAHHPVIFMGAFLFFLGVVKITEEYQEPLRLQQALLVGFFLGGLVVLGGMQAWWLKPLLTSLGDFQLYAGAAALTAITDNAALTYLGSQVETLPENSRYLLVSGAVIGGGLTVIANAPNPAGYGILNSSFGSEGINPLKLFLNALPPTLFALAVYWIF